MGSRRSALGAATPSLKTTNVRGTSSCERVFLLSGCRAGLVGRNLRPPFNLVTPHQKNLRQAANACLVDDSRASEFPDTSRVDGPLGMARHQSLARVRLRSCRSYWTPDQSRNRSAVLVSNIDQSESRSQVLPARPGAVAAATFHPRSQAAAMFFVEKQEVIGPLRTRQNQHAFSL